MSSQISAPRASRATAVVASCAFALVTAISSAAQAQVEARCPAGWEAVPLSSEGLNQRPIAACRRAGEGTVLIALEIGRRIAPGDPNAAVLAAQLAMQAGVPPPQQPPTFRAETLGGVAAQVTELSAQGQTQQGEQVTVQVVVAILPVGERTVVIRAVTDNPQRTPGLAAARELAATMAGLDGSAPAWRASAECPAGLVAVPSDAPPANGTRRVARCAAEDRSRQVEVLESRLRVANAADARASAMFHQALLQRELAQLGGTATVEPTQPARFGAVQGFTTVVRGQASDPRVAPGTPGAAIRLDMGIVVIPTPGGHVQVVAVTQGAAPPAALQETLRAMVTQQLRLDGAGAPVASAGGDGGVLVAGDGGAAIPAPRPRRREVDLSQPLWTPPPEERPRASTQPSSSNKTCGCAVPGHAPRARDALAAPLALAAALALARRRRNRSSR